MQIRSSLFAVLVGLAGVAAMAGGWFAARSLSDQREPSLEQDLGLAKVKLPALEGGEDGPANAVGNVVLLDFWASWCSPCHVQSRLIGALVEDYEPRGVRFFAINVGEPLEVVRRSLEEHPIDFDVLLDTTGEVAAGASVFGLPTLIVLDRSGAVAMRREGLTSERALRATLDELLSASAAEEPGREAGAAPGG